MAEKDGSGNIKKIYINDGTGILGMTRAIYDDSGTFSYNKRYYFLTDALGSVSNVTNDKGKLLQEYFYDPYGKTWNMASDPVNNLRFVGKYGGYADDATGLTYFWHRWYDSKEGRWISRDPINVLDGINLYRYVKNRPNIFSDFTGLKLIKLTHYKDCTNGCSELDDVSTDITQEAMEESVVRLIEYYREKEEAEYITSQIDSFIDSFKTGCDGKPTPYEIKRRELDKKMLLKLVGIGGMDLLLDKILEKFFIPSFITLPLTAFEMTDFINEYQNELQQLP